MKLRAILLSLCVHLSLVATALYFHLRSEYPRPADNLVVEAPVGSVFVHEEVGPSGRTSEGNSALVAPTTFSDNGSEGTTNEDSPHGLPDGEARPIGKINPIYPAMSRKLGEEGEAVFMLGIDADGSVTNATLEKSSGSERLDKAAREMLLNSEFHPAMMGGQPTIGMKRFRVEFRLNGTQTSQN